MKVETTKRGRTVAMTERNEMKEGVLESFER